MRTPYETLESTLERTFYCQEKKSGNSPFKEDFLTHLYTKLHNYF